MMPINKEGHDYNIAAQATYENEMYLLSKAQEYGEFCVMCDRKRMKLITFEDYLKLCKDKT